MVNRRETRILPAIGRRVFSAPYLPRGLVGITLLIIITNAVLFLMGRPPEYWVDYTHTNAGLQFIQQILAIHPLLYVGVVIIYLMVVGLFLDGLSHTPALILWVIVNFLHVDNTIYWIKQTLIPYLSLTEPAKDIIYTFLSIAFAGILGWSVARGLLSKRGTEGDTTQTALLLKPKSFRKAAISVTAIWLLILAIGLITAMMAPVSGWLVITSEHTPSPRVDGKIAYDSHREKAILFGGHSAWTGYDWLYDTETWEWDGSDWQQLFPDETPPSRGASGMAYDEKRLVTVMFGGANQNNNLDDTWEWDGGQWHQAFPSSIPPAREGHQMIYDPQRERVVLYGGYDGIGTFFNDAWEWDGQQWRQITFETTSPVASNFIMAYDQASTHVTAFLSGIPGGTWLWQGERWAKVQKEGEEPEGRSSPNAVYDSKNEQLVLFGGLRDGELLDDTWLLEGLRWRQLNLTLSATARWGHAMYYDPNRERVIIFGGYDNENVLKDMWELELPDGG